jgi:putative ABC transport system substrate-binding protein
MKKKILLLALCAMLLALYVPAEAQQPKKIPQIGYLANDSHAPTRETFRQGLSDFGYVEGQTIQIEWRFTEGKPGGFPEFAAELVRLKVDVIVAGASGAVSFLQRATRTIPIVMTGYGGDPVADGIVTSFARPGGNITGLVTLAPDLSGKQLELLKEIVPKLSRVAVMRNPDDSGAQLQWERTQTAARALGLQLLSLEIRSVSELDKSMEAATRGRVDALMVLRGGLSYLLRKQIVVLAEKNRLPGIYFAGEFVEAGGLMSYSSINDAQYRRAAYYVDRILKEAKPADLPIEAPTKFELVINLKAAKQISLTIPPSVLARADKVIR